MRAAQWSSVLFLTCIIALSCIHFLMLGPAGAEDPTRPDRGVLAPVLDPPPTKVVVARIDPDFGKVLDLAADGENLAILTTGGWTLQSPGSAVTWWGDRTPGSPDWLSRPVSIAIGPGIVFVLDEKRSSVSVWDEGLNRLEDLPLPLGNTFTQRPVQMILDPGGNPLVTIQRVEPDGAASWRLLQHTGSGGFSEVLSLPNESKSMVFETPLLARGDSTLYLLAPLTFELARMEVTAGRINKLPSRTDPPLWYVPRRHRRDYRRMLGGLEAGAAQLSELPEFWPSVRDFCVGEAGAFLVAITAGEDLQHVELLTRELVPVGRFNPGGFREPVFLSGGRVFLVEEEMDETVIYELVADEG